MKIDSALRYLDSHRESFVDRLFELLRIPSISTLEEYREQVLRAAQWCRDLLEAIGLEAEIVPTEGHPVVLASLRVSDDAPTVMIYGHYDVQPPGDEPLWNSPPFEPTVRDGRIFARGAADDKGQMLTSIFALECWLAGTAALPTNIVVMLEGEEEIGSPSFAGFLEQHAERLRCDCVLAADAEQFKPGWPAVVYGTRGLVYKEITLTGPSSDLHSGSYGGIAPNPANVLCEVIASLKDRRGRITIPGFYDSVTPLSQVEREMFAALPFDEQQTKDSLGLQRLEGEEGFSPLERLWTRPTLDVNGLAGGFAGQGAATIIPAKATAKISMRLVPQQDPKRISRAFDEFVERLVAGRCRIQIREHASCPAYIAPLEWCGIKAARKAIKAAWATAPALVRAGGTLPILPLLKAKLGADTVMPGYCQPNCGAHGPNEFLGLHEFFNGIKTAIHFLEYFRNLADEEHARR